MSDSQIKFRAWDREINCMVCSFTVHQLADGWLKDDGHGGRGYNSDSFTYMQYTGLKDKNGVEIYEGDIVRLAKSYWPAFQHTVAYAVIHWWDYKAGFYGKEFIKPAHINGEIISSISELKYYGDFEVIGNIHENHELLKGKKNE